MLESIELEPREPQRHSLEKKKKCPQCPLEVWYADEVEEYFGYRWSAGKKIPQAWCKVCRRVSASAKPAPAPNYATFPAEEKGDTAMDTPEQEAPKTEEIPEPEYRPEVITANKEAVRALYAKYFPKDSNGGVRALKFMVQKLIKKLPDAIVEEQVKTMFSL